MADSMNELPQHEQPQPQQSNIPSAPPAEPRGLTWQLKQIHFAWKHPDLKQGWWLVSMSYGLLVCILTLLVLDTVRVARVQLQSSAMEASTHE